MKSPQRQGIAFLMVIFLLLIIVAASVQLMIRQEIRDRHAIEKMRRVKIMESAIESVKHLPLNESIRLPLDNERKESMVIRFDEATSKWNALWIRSGVTLDSLSRTSTSLSPSITPSKN